MLRLKTVAMAGVLLILVCGSTTLAAPPPLPASLYGAAKLDAVNVSAGTAVSAWINGVQYAETATFFVDTDSVYRLDVPGDNPDTSQIEGGREGDTVVFKIAGYETDQTTYWHSSAFSRLDLSARTGPDLVVTAINLNGATTDPQLLLIGGTGKATIKNRGNKDVPASAGFALTFFEDRNGDAAYSPALDNTLGQATYSAGLTVGAEAEVSALVTGEVLFRDNLVYVFVDSGNAIGERDETNNLANSGMRCEYRPPVGQFNPGLEWEWTGSSVSPQSSQVMMPPAVVDLTGDGVSDIVFNTFAGNDYWHQGNLRAINGRDGSEIFTIADSRYLVYGGVAVAVGDIDLDGHPEILTSDESTDRIIAFEHDGSFKWRSPEITGGLYSGIGSLSVVIADLDGDGVPEIIAGANVLNNDGTARWTKGVTSTGSQQYGGPLSITADLDLQGTNEVVVGNSAYRSDGSLYWRNDSMEDGYNAVGNFDDDAFPEVVLVTRGKVYLLEHDGSLKWGSVILPGGSCYFGLNDGGPPVVADLDNDSQPEIGVAGGCYYTVLETDGTLRWSSPTRDDSGVTGSSVFDFDSDGSAEIVYADEYKLRIYRGADGAVLWETPRSSGTDWELPVIADVDADGNAEIVIGSNNWRVGSMTGLQVYGDANDTWVPTRAIWNQDTYHINNVNDDGTVPQDEPPSWLTHNTYRCQAAPEPFRAPDLTASRLLFDFAGLPDSLSVTARIGNGGAIQVGAGVPVAFYDGDPTAGGTLIGVVTTTNTLRPGEYEDVSLDWASPSFGVHDVYVVADDDGTGHSAQNECNETNNTHHLVVDTRVVGPDLIVPSVDRSGLITDFQALTIVGTVAAQIKNQGNLSVTQSFDVTFFEDLDGDGHFTAGTDNLLGQSTRSGGLDIGASASVWAAVSGTVLFRDNLIYAFADSTDALQELDETNNLNNTGACCQYQPPIGQFNPRLKWAWTSSAVEPASTGVLMTPAVADLNEDGVPDLVLGSSSTVTGSYFDVGVLRAISGDDGRELFTVTDPSMAINTASSIAIGDIDSDGRPEIIACDSSSARLIAFEHDGSFKWRSSDLEPINWGAPALADIDKVGAPEIVIGRQVLNNDGTVRWTGTGGFGTQGYMRPLSLVADVNLDGNPEIVAGNTVYAADGSILWQASVPDGYNAVANFDSDPYPEIVLVSGGTVRLMEHDGTIKWGPVSIPGGGSGGPPTIADYDGDGQVEIGVAGAVRYAVFETDGSLKWDAVTQDLSSNVTGSSVFDFEGDGAAEVLYRDELKLRVYRGTDGAVLFETPMISGTWVDYPLVADVDNDGNAELVAVASYDDLDFQRGVYVFGDANDNWVPTRKIWNQHTYHITNVNDDGTIPRVELNNWQVPYGNNYRLNTQMPGPSRFAAPDLTASYLRADFTNLPTWARITARVGNGGANVAPAGIPVAFYDGDPAGGGTSMGTVTTTRTLLPGQYEEVTLIWAAPEPRVHDIYAVADDDGTGHGTQNECNETNNTHHFTVDTRVQAPDLLVMQVDANATTTDPQALTISGTVSAQIKNDGGVGVSIPFAILFFEDWNSDGRFTAGVDKAFGQTTYTTGLAPGASAQVLVPLSDTVLFRDNLIYAFVDSGNVINEYNEANNINNGGAGCAFHPPVGQFDPRLEWAWTTSSILPEYNGVMMTPAVIDLDEDGIPDIVFSTFYGTNFDDYHSNCHLRAISGRDGRELFTVTDPAYDVEGSSSTTVGDIDLDGKPEILVPDESRSRILAFEHNGTFKWRSPQIPGADPFGTTFLGGQALDDLDHDGVPEIVTGAAVLNNDGSIRWADAEARNVLVSVTNLDLTGNDEIVVGSTAYRSDGSVYWRNENLTSGWTVAPWTAVGNFDEDAYPEVVLVTQQRVYLLEHDGALKWGPSILPGPPGSPGAWNEGGAPIVADVDGDGKPEIGVAGGYFYSVFEHDGTLKWSSPTHDLSSGETASSAFDFDGDGSMEIIYKDEYTLHIYRGPDGTVLWETTSTSGTGWEGPIVADVDADGNAEIVMSSNNQLYQGSTGIQVYGDANDTWVPARQIWNQHAYHVTNVNDDGTIPQVEIPSWLTHNTYRCQAAPEPFRAPDLAASYLRLEMADVPGTDVITIRIGNGGANVAAAGTQVAYYDGDPGGSGVLLGTAATSRDLSPGEYEDVTYTWTTPTQGNHDIYVVADDDGTGHGTQNECNETNNTHWQHYVLGPNWVELRELGASRQINWRLWLAGGLLTLMLGAYGLQRLLGPWPRSGERAATSTNCNIQR